MMAARLKNAGPPFFRALPSQALQKVKVSVKRTAEKVVREHYCSLTIARVA
jgi:hypothetical protein